MTTLSPLTSAIYDVLRGRVPATDPRITYKELVQALPSLSPPCADLHWRDPRLDEALGELVTACRAASRPALSAIVVNGETRQPGSRYYEVAHAGVRYPLGREVAWGKEFEAARVHTYPPGL